MSIWIANVGVILNLFYVPVSPLVLESNMRTLFIPDMENYLIVLSGDVVFRA